MSKCLKSITWFLSILMLLVSCATAPDPLESRSIPTQPKESKGIALLVETEWLEENRNAYKLRLIDYGRKAKDYQSGHIPGAVFVDRTAVWAKVDGISGMLPSKESMVETMVIAGISYDNTVVIYDNTGGLWASRLFWALEYLGHKDVHILNGGWKKWVHEKRQVQRKAPAVTRSNFTARVQPGLLATKTWILENLSNPNVQVVDTRSRREYIGEDLRAAQGGHIPGAVNINWISNLNSDDSSTFLPEENLAELYESMNILKDKIVVTHCQTGVRGAHTYFVLRLLGYPEVRVYDGSWAEWGNNRDTPIVTEDTGAQ
jgi:thiosulfate/3-mercaptopyruvate sulfurtransferase